MAALIISPTLATPTSYAQNAPSQEALERVQDYLRGQYGTDYLLLRYNWQRRTWPDTSLDCPRMGFTYEQREIEGWQWQFTLNDNSAYTLHSNLDASLIVLCTDIDRSQTLRFDTYQNNDFTIDYPETWQVNANDDLSDVVLSPTGEVDCSIAGLRVQFVPVAGNANTMLDAVLQEAGFVDNIGVRVPVGDDPDALALGYQAPCGSNLMQYRVGAFPNSFVGTGYLVIERAPLDEYNQWATVFDRVLQSFRLTDTLETLPAVEETVPPSQALENYPLAHLFVGDIYIGTYNQLPGEGLTVGGNRARRSLRFSDDGLYLAYVEEDPNTASERLELAGTTIRRTRVGEPLAPHFPPAWAPNEVRVAFLEAGENGLRVQTVSPLDTGNVQTVGMIPFDYTTCADASSERSTVERLYEQETGPAGNGFAFVWLLDGRFLYTTACDGTGLAIWNPADNTIQELGADLRRARLTPDRTRLAAIGAENEAFVIDLSGGERTRLTVEVAAEQLSWSEDGRFVYLSSRRPSDTGFPINTTDREDLARELFGVFPYESVLNTLTLTEFDLRRGTNRVVWEGQGFAVGRIITAPNNAGLVFSLIPTDRQLAVAFAQQEDPFILRFERPETELYWLSPITENSRKLAVSAYPAFAYTVPPVPTE